MKGPLFVFLCVLLVSCATPRLVVWNKPGAMIGEFEQARADAMTEAEKFGYAMQPPLDMPLVPFAFQAMQAAQHRERIFRLEMERRGWRLQYSGNNVR